MELRDQCQLAELIGVGLGEQGLVPRSRPWLWMSTLLAPLLGSAVPMLRSTRADREVSVLVHVILLPLMLVAFVLVLPFEWLQSRRMRLHNARATQRLAAARPASPTGYREAATAQPRQAGGRVASAGELARWLHQADRLAAVDFRVSYPTGAALLGAALVAFSPEASAGEGKQLVWLSAYRGEPPAEALDAERAAAAVADLATRPCEVAHLEWSIRDPYELTERQARPW